MESTWLGHHARDVVRWTNDFSMDLMTKYESMAEFGKRRRHLVPYAFSDKSGDLSRASIRKFGDPGIVLVKPGNRGKLKSLVIQYMSGVDNLDDWEKMTGFYFAHKWASVSINTFTMQHSTDFSLDGDIQCPSTCKDIRKPRALKWIFMNLSANTRTIITRICSHYLKINDISIFGTMLDAAIRADRRYCICMWNSFQATTNISRLQIVQGSRFTKSNANFSTSCLEEHNATSFQTHSQYNL